MAKARPQRQRAAAAAGAAEPFRSISTATLAPLLQSLGSSLILSTYQTSRVVIVHATSTASIHTHFAEHQRPMGIAIGNHCLSIGCERSVWDFRSQPSLAPTLGTDDPYDACYLPRNIHFTGQIGVHEITFAGDELWIVNTAFSALCTLDELHSVVPRWQPPFITAFSPEDRCHLNGLAVADGHVRYVTAFAATDEPNGWRGVKDPSGVVIDVATNEIVARGLVRPHSPRWYDGRLWVLESGKGTLATVDPRNGSAATVAEVPGFARGLAFAGPYAFIGLSHVRDGSFMGDMPLLRRVPECECGVWVVDIRDGSVAAFLRFEGSVQEVFDVQLMGVRHPALLDVGSSQTGLTIVVPDPARPGAPVGTAFQIRLQPESAVAPKRRRRLAEGAKSSARLPAPRTTKKHS